MRILQMPSLLLILLLSRSHGPDERPRRVQAPGGRDPAQREAGEGSGELARGLV